MVLVRSISWVCKVFLLALLVSGCQVGPRYHPPEMVVAEGWKAPQGMMPLPQVACWWEIFQDPTLDHLIKQAICNNPSLEAASQRIEQARAMAQMTKSRLVPQLNFDPSTSNKPLRVHTFGATNTPPPTLIKDHIAKYALPFTLLYEFDFWGKWRNQYKAAIFRAEAEWEGYQTVLLFLTTDLANLYFQLRIQDAQIELFRKILETRHTASNIQQSRYSLQLRNYLDVSFYQLDYSTIESEYFDALKQRMLIENQMALLLGISPSEFTQGPLPLMEKPPHIPATLPAAVLLRRPDLAEQERRMAAFHAEINVAYASYLPSIDLAATFAFLSNNFVETMRNVWSIGGNLTQIFFDGGARRANVKLFTAKFNEAVALYREIALTAFQEVEDSLSSIKWIENEMDAIANGINAMETASQISLDRYTFGLADYLEVANNERLTLEQQRLYLQLLSQLYLHTLHLIKAIGGGW